MLVLQYYASSEQQLHKIEALAQLLNCDYRVTENIVAIVAENLEAMSYLSKADISPSYIQHHTTE